MSDIDLVELLDREGPVTWLFCGDSITQGARHTRGLRDYTQLFRERLGEMARNEDIVLNTAVGGWSLAALEPRLEERILRHRPNVVLLMFGTNDAAAGRGGLDAFTGRYDAILGRIRDAGITTTVVQTAVPVFPVDPQAAIAMSEWPDPEVRAGKLKGLTERVDSLERYVLRTREVAARCSAPLVDHWAAWTAVGGARGQLMDGGFHPNEYGHRLVAHTLFRSCGIWDDASWTCRLFVPVD